MSNTLKFGNGQWATKKGSTLAYNDENGNFKPLPFNFERSTSATRVNKQGLIEVVSNNEPRIDFKDDSNGALLLEPQSTNLVTYSEDFSNASWTKVRTTVSSSVILDPKGTADAFKLTGNNLTNSDYYLSIPPINDGNIYTLSFFAKKAELDECILLQRGIVGSVTYFDLTNGLIISKGSAEIDAKIKSYPNDWFRISMTFTANGGLSYAIGLSKNNTNFFTNNGSEGIYVFGAQLEQGSYATSYIPTQGSVGTRVAETCSNENLNVDYSGDYTLYLEHETLSLTEYNQFQFRQETSISYIFRVGNSINIGTGLYTTANTIGFNKFALSVTSSGSYNFYKNGVLLSSGSGLNANLETIKNDALGMSIKDIKLYNTALTDQELIALTS